MKIIVELNRIDILPEEHNFNWVKLYFSTPDQDGNNDFSATIEIRVPKTIQDIREIKKYSLQQAKDFLAHCTNADFVD